MRAIHLSNNNKRDAEVAFGTHLEEKDIRTVLPGGEEKQNVKILKATIELDDEALVHRYGDLTDLAHALIESDPEIDMEIIGRKLKHTHKLYVNKDNEIAYRITLYQVVRNPDGTERERRDLNKLPSNINADIPLRWTGKRFPKKDVIRQFVFTRKYQIRHINGATFDFLYNMARELDESKTMVLVGAGPKGDAPILLSRGGEPYRGFLEGRIEGEKYCLILHLSNIELKALKP